MKLTCDLCGGALQVNLGGQGATCLTCGLGYTMDRLREKLSLQQFPADPPLPKKVDDYDTPAPAPIRKFDFVPRQFVMENTGGGTGDLSGLVQQGGIGLGDSVYINGDYSQSYQIYSINDDPDVTCAKEGMPTDLFLVVCPRKVLRNARTITGNLNPLPNAYNYPGSVEDYFSSLLPGEFSEYDIQKNVLRDELSIPVSFMFFRSGRPALAVFLIDSNDSKARWQVQKAARILAPEGIACTHFFSNYRNDMPYVIQRVRTALGC